VEWQRSCSWGLSLPSRSGRLCAGAADGAAEIGDRLLLPNKGKPSELLWGLVFLAKTGLVFPLRRSSGLKLRAEAFKPAGSGLLIDGDSGRFRRSRIAQPGASGLSPASSSWHLLTVRPYRSTNAQISFPSASDVPAGAAAIPSFLSASKSRQQLLQNA